MFKRLAAILSVWLFVAAPALAGNSVWEAAEASIGLQGRWLDGITKPSEGDLEAAGNLSLSLTPHINVTGGVAYGFNGAYGRAQADARICATDIHDEYFSLWLGIGRYWSKRSSDGLDEWAGKSGLAWRPSHQYVFTLGLTTAVGLSTGRPSLTISGTYPFKLIKEAGQ